MLNRLLLPALLATSLGLAACGSDDAGSSSASSAATTPAATSADHADMDMSSTPATGADATPAVYDASSGSVTIKATEFAFSPSVIKAKAGKLKITMDNAGDTVHELVVLKTDDAPGALKVTDGEVSEKDSVGEISETDAGTKQSHTFDLKAGKYVIVCNVNGHYMKGMYGSLLVQ